ncbi:MAG: peptidylprolyl isomerase [Campylobacteraceae bacterium]|nr:peptidylprolyl isomerase [Campylobacteraceae bacterium]
MSIEINKVVSIEYNLIDANTKEQLDSNVGGQPLEFISGKGQIIQGLEDKVIAMEVGDKADVLVEAANAYGDYKEDSVQKLPKEQFAGIELTEGMSLYGTGEQGETVQVLVKSFDDEEVIIDYNHPMAGKTLMFSVEVLSERAATEDEVTSGMVGGAAASSGCCGSKDTSAPTQGGGCGC